MGSPRPLHEQQTIEGLRRSLASAPDNDEVRLALATALMQAGQPGQALPHFRRLALRPHSKRAHWMGLAYALLRTGDLPGAEAAVAQLSGSGVSGPPMDALRLELRRAKSEPAIIRRGDGRIRVMRGLPPGCAQPAMTARVHLHCPPELDLAALERALAEHLDIEMAAGPPAGDRHEALGLSIVRAAVGLQRAAALPVFEDGMVLWSGPGQDYTLIVPYADAAAGPMALDWMLVTASDLLRDATAAADWAPLLAGLREQGEELVSRLKQFASPTGNSIHFLRAAHRMGVPCRRVAGHAYQVGHGIHGRWLDSSITDRTSTMGNALARDKISTAAVLRRAGLPVPRHAGALTIEAAIEIAGHLGYPVVVKPVDLDGGRGVAAGLEDETALRKAFAATKEHAERVLVEKHVDGDDFRLVVMGGKVTWAIERIPGGVTGDGRRTLEALLAEVNADPRRGDGKHASLQRVEWDEEAQHLAALQGLTGRSVPAAGRFVKLRRITNVARGGMPVAFPLARVHPANLRLAERAAAALRLDLAGIDLIIPDISRPWHEVGGAINEVNARPSFGLITAGHLFADIIRWLLDGGDGRIPVVAVTGGAPDLATAVARQVQEWLCEAGTRAGLATRHGAWIGREQVSWADMAGEPGGALLLTDPDAEAAVIEMPVDRLAWQGAPFDRCDVAVHLGSAGGATTDEFHEAGLLRRTVRAVVRPLADVAHPDGAHPDIASGAVRIAVSPDGRPADLPPGVVAVWPDGSAIMVGAPTGDLRTDTGQPVSLAHLYAHAVTYGLRLQSLPAVAGEDGKR